MLTEYQIELVTNSWNKVIPIAETAAEIFYKRLFELDPSLKTLFNGDMKQQGDKLMSMITIAVKALNRLDDVVPAIQQMGRRHVNYNVEPEHYNTVGAALLWTLGQSLGDGFTAEVEEAWTVVYGILSTTMIDAANSVEPA
jgi:hemoglobin-like flavoprotein